MAQGQLIILVDTFKIVTSYLECTGEERSKISSHYSGNLLVDFLQQPNLKSLNSDKRPKFLMFGYLSDCNVLTHELVHPHTGLSVQS